MSFLACRLYSEFKNYSPPSSKLRLQKRRRDYVQQHWTQKLIEMLIEYFYTVVRMKGLATAKSTVDVLSRYQKVLNRRFGIVA